VLYAFPVHFYQYQQIIQDLIDVFQSTEIEVHLKYHPLFQSSVNNIQLPSNFKIWSKDNKKLNETYDVILFNDNSFGIESLLMGVKSYEYEFDEYYDETRLIGFGIYNAKIDKDKLFNLKDQMLLDDFDKTYSKEAVASYISNMYKWNNRLDDNFI